MFWCSGNGRKFYYIHNIKASTSFATKLIKLVWCMASLCWRCKSVYVFGREYALIEPNTLYLNKTSEEYEILPVWLHLQNYAPFYSLFGYSS